MTERERVREWSAQAPAVPASVSQLRRALVAFAAAHGADPWAQDGIALATSEAITNAVVHAFIGIRPGTVWVTAAVAGDALHVTITDDGTGTKPRPDSPGLGLGLTVIAKVATSVAIGEGPGGRGTEMRLQFALAR